MENNVVEITIFLHKNGDISIYLNTFLVAGQRVHTDEVERQFTRFVDRSFVLGILDGEAIP